MDVNVGAFDDIGARHTDHLAVLYDLASGRNGSDGELVAEWDLVPNRQIADARYDNQRSEW